jgi:hypothetical protein
MEETAYQLSESKFRYIMAQLYNGLHPRPEYNKNFQVIQSETIEIQRDAILNAARVLGQFDTLNQFQLPEE